MRGLNNKGFTLVELLAVLVILAAIMGIALPSITSSMERNKDKQNESKKKLLESFAEIYVSDHKVAIYDNLEALSSPSNPITECYIAVSELRSEGYLSDDADIDADGNQMDGNIYFNKSNNIYIYSDEKIINEETNEVKEFKFYFDFDNDNDGENDFVILDKNKTCN